MLFLGRFYRWDIYPKNLLTSEGFWKNKNKTVSSFSFLLKIDSSITVFHLWCCGGATNLQENHYKLNQNSDTFALIRRWRWLSNFPFLFQHLQHTHKHNYTHTRWKCADSAIARGKNNMHIYQVSITDDQRQDHANPVSFTEIIWPGGEFRWFFILVQTWHISRRYLFLWGQRVSVHLLTIMNINNR